MYILCFLYDSTTTLDSLIVEVTNDLTIGTSRVLMPNFQTFNQSENPCQAS